MNRTQQGFTIVELIIVITVISILATLSFVGYSGVVTNGKSQSAQTSASSVQKKIESYASSTGSYPDSTTNTGYTSQLNGRSESSLSGTSVVLGTPGPANGQQTVEVSQCTAPAGPRDATAYRIRYWDFGTSKLSTTVLSASISPIQCTTWDPLD